MAEYTREWSQFKFDKPLEMVRRDSLQPGDVAYSSHYGKRTVERVTFLGDENQSTRIYWTDRKHAYQQQQNEIYDSASEVPLVSRAADDPLARIRRWVDEHINQPTDDDWGEGYLAAVKRVQAEIEGIDRQKEQTP